MVLSSGNRKYPWPVRHGWMMAHMLAMTARQIGDPISLFVLMISDNRLLHRSCESRDLVVYGILSSSLI